MRRLPIIILLSAALLALPILLTGNAQPAPDEFDTFMSEAISDFDSFIDEANRDFVDFMRNPWDKFDAEKPVEKRVVPEPVVQPKADPAAKPDTTPHRLTIEEIIDLTSKESGKGKGEAAGGKATPTIGFEKPKPKPAKPEPAKPKTEPVKEQPVTQKPQPAKPEPQKPATQKPEQQKPTDTTPVAKKPEPTVAPEPITPPAPKPVPKPTPKPAAKPQPPQATATTGLPVQFGGITYRVSDALAGKVPNVKTNERSIANAYESLLKSDYKPLVEDLRQLRANGLNNDWALFLFVKDVADKLATGNSAQVLRQFLLNQLGFRARVAIVPSEQRLALYFAPNVDMYGVVYVTVDGVKYYDADGTTPYAFFMCSREAPAAKNKLNMNMAAMPAFNSTARTTTHTGSGRSAGVSVTVPVPEQLAAFYRRLPQCDYSVYADAIADESFEASVLPQLRKAIEGKSETEAATLLLDYVQHAFDYATDQQQFGYEKPFFVEELYYYPQCDCEDRSVFYRYLVKKLLGLDAVLLEYPNHLATAVRFSTPQNGDYVSVGGQTYTVCDPTYIGASIGMAMPMFKNTAAKVVKL